MTFDAASIELILSYFDSEEGESSGIDLFEVIEASSTTYPDLSYDSLREYMTQLTGYGPKLWELIFADQLKCTKENIEVCLDLGIAKDGSAAGATQAGRYNFWDDSGDYLHAALTLSNEMHSNGIIDLDWDALWAFFDTKITQAGECEGWGSWDDAAADALSDYACDGVSEMVFKLVRLMMALKYYDGEGS